MIDPKLIRNVAIIAHDGAGKTALTEALLRHEAPQRASKDGSTSHLDSDPEEAKRNFTVATHITYADHEGVLLNLLDTAGFSDFLTDADRSRNPPPVAGFHRFGTRGRGVVPAHAHAARLPVARDRRGPPVRARS